MPRSAPYDVAGQEEGRSIPWPWEGHATEHLTDALERNPTTGN